MCIQLEGKVGEMITNLLGRKVKSQYGGTITTVYVDRGITKAVIENPDSRLNSQTFNWSL
jgi:hypothetical protein